MGSRRISVHYSQIRLPSEKRRPSSNDAIKSAVDKLRMITGYRRVSARCPCRICGKPDWCSTTRDNSISFCARNTCNSDRLSSKGWGVFYSGKHNQFSSYRVSYVMDPPILKRRMLASIELRNYVYNDLIKLTGTLPKGFGERLRIVQSLIKSSFNGKNREISFTGVPGFWLDSDGNPRLGIDGEYHADMLLIPFRDSNGLIRGCQLKSVEIKSKYKGRYLWLSSANKLGGCGPGTPLHHEGSFKFKNRDFERVLVTEGALKAVTAQNFLPDRYVIANSGVSTSHREIVKSSRKRSLEIAFDSDSFTNPHVARAVASLVGLRFREQEFLSCDKPTKILTWDKRFKGIDDALLAGVSIRQLDIGEWLELLTPECLDAAQRQLAGIVFRK